MCMKSTVKSCFSFLNLANCAFSNFSLTSLTRDLATLLPNWENELSFVVVNILYCIYVSYIYLFGFIFLFFFSLKLFCCSNFKMDALITNSDFIFYYMLLCIYMYVCVCVHIYNIIYYTYIYIYTHTYVNIL